MRLVLCVCLMSAPVFISCRNAARVAGEPAKSPLAARHSSPDQEQNFRSLGRLLVEDGILKPKDLLRALDLQRQENVSLGDILVGQELIAPNQLTHALARQCASETVDLTEAPPDASLTTLFDPLDCMRLGFLPWQRREGQLVLAISRPEAIPLVRMRLPPEAGEPAFIICNPDMLHDAITDFLGSELIQYAETRAPSKYSCRDWSTVRSRLITGIAGLILAFGIGLAPSMTISVLLLLATFILVLNSGLKAICFGLALWRRPQAALQSKRQRRRSGLKRPRISVLVPLFHEENIASALIKRLSQIQYPPELLEICLVIEASDQVTRDAVARATLPVWMKVVRVPPGGLQTKPRAMNYALDFTTGDIIGVYDAEDAPDPDQLTRVADRFANALPDLACVQGILSFYNPHTNWLSRCFSFEYAAWFRVMLPGLEKLGFAIPLGGTTVFFRRDILVRLGAWDAHNVTEDADLGMRLARKGYRCEIIETVTHEEANSRLWPWVRQRSRWLKGYAVTWAVHMRDPRQLWRDLGARKFVGFQLLFLGTLAAFFFAPVLWFSVIVTALGLTHPIMSILPGIGVNALASIYVAAEIISISVFALAISKVKKRPGFIWVLTMPFYFIFATLAAYKGTIELLFRPFYWDKTEHGDFGGTDIQPASDTDLTRIDFEAGLERDGEMITQRL